MESEENNRLLHEAQKKIRIDVPRYISESSIRTLCEKLSTLQITSLHFQGDEKPSAAPAWLQQQSLSQFIDLLFQEHRPSSIKISSIRLNSAIVEKMLKALQDNASFNELSLHNCRLGDTLFERLFEDCKLTTKLIKLDLSGNELDDRSAEVLKRVVHASQKLERLELSSNSFSKKTVKKIYSTLANHENLKKLKMCDCGLERDSLELLSSLLERNSKIILMDVRDNFGLTKKISLQIFYRLQANAVSQKSFNPERRRNSRRRSVLRDLLIYKNGSSSSLFGISEEKLQLKKGITKELEKKSNTIDDFSGEISFSNVSGGSLSCSQPPLSAFKARDEVSLDVKCSSCVRLTERVLKLEAELERLHLLIKKAPTIYNNSTINANMEEEDTPQKNESNFSLIAPPRFEHDRPIQVEKIIKDLDLLIDVSDQKDQTMEREPHLTNSYSAVYNNTVNYHNHASDSNSQVFIFGDNKTNLSCIEKKGNLSIVAEKSVFVLNERNSGFYLDANDKDLDLKSEVLCDRNILGQLEKED